MVRLAEEGARVFAVDRDLARLAETVSLAGGRRHDRALRLTDATTPDNDPEETSR